MKINNGFNILPWYDSLEKQNCKKWYAYGQAWPLLCPQGSILPFQFISDTAISISSNIYAISVETGRTVDLGVKPTVTEVRRADITYYIVKLVSTSIVNLPIGRYNLRMNTSEGFLYSEELVVINNANECIKVEYWNEDTLKFTSGEINFTDDFHFIFYINSTIGKPEYEFEEELTKRLGYKFIESQTSNKVYKFSFVAPEYICDAMRLIRMCDYIKLTTKFDSYNALSFAYEPKWQEQGDLAAVDVEFDTDCIIQKLESFNRRAKESFYNALLADIDEPVLFSTDTVAQYYTEYTASGAISGKLIRQLTAISEDELTSSLSSIVLPVDNQSDTSQVAKKAFLSDIVNKLIPKVNLSDYLLKSIWDKVFEIRTDRQGKEYIFGKLPVVTQYGITMYADGGDIDLPSLYAGLPIDNTTIYWENGVLKAVGSSGGGVADSVAWGNVTGKPSWITATKPKYSYTEIEGTPDLSKYALKTDIPSLSGYATESWVIGKGYALGSDLDALASIVGNKADKTELAKYIPISGYTEVSGEKNFTGGLKVNGSPIYYDTEKKYWKLEGDLLVTGDITMYGSDSSFTPSTIMDAIAVDGTTISKSGGVLKVIGGTGGGVADSVAWANITGKPTWIGSSKPTYSYSEITGAISTTELQNYLTSNSYLNVTSGDNRYLKLTGGILNGSVYLNGDVFIRDSIVDEAILGYSTAAEVMILGASSRVTKLRGLDLLYNNNTIWHSGNDGSGSGLDADLLDGKHADSFMNFASAKTYVGASMGNENLSKLASGDGYIEFWDGAGGWFNGKWGKLIAVSGFEGSLSGNASSATKLQTARTIWGQSFDGTGNISGSMTGLTYILGFASIRNSSNVNETNGIWVGSSISSALVNTDLAYNATKHIFYTGNVGIGTTNPAYKLDVNGITQSTALKTNSLCFECDSSGSTSGRDGEINRYTGAVHLQYATNKNITLCFGGGNVGIGTTNPSCKLHVSGDILATGGITMHSMRDLKNVIDERGLSLSELSAIKPTRYTWKDGRDNRLHFGGIADDIQQVLPEVVYKTSDGILTMDYGNAAFAVASSLIKPVIDHEKRIAMLEEENKQLRQEVERLKSA